MANAKDNLSLAASPRALKRKASFSDQNVEAVSGVENHEAKRQRIEHATRENNLSLATSSSVLKRKEPCSDGHADGIDNVEDHEAKRHRIDYSVATPPETPSPICPDQADDPKAAAQADKTERLLGIIEMQFSTEILVRHQELRFIEQELAKSQTALEQLRRCHLIPYPTSCPTPQQMLDIIDGKGPAVEAISGSTPEWAPPYGVVDGPYARHYAKWLIPDPKFDGQLPEWQMVPATSGVLGEGRSTRNSQQEGATIGKRVARGQTGQALKFQTGTVPAPAPVPKVKGPCVTKRTSDGVLVKLVCEVCQRVDFNSVQGFINHCRIAHSKEYKTHEQAAEACGYPVEADEVALPAIEEDTPTAAPAPHAASTGTVHPLARSDATDGQNVYFRVLQRIEASLQLFHRGKLAGISSIPGVPDASFNDVAKEPSKSFVGSSATPFLSQLLQSQGSDIDLKQQVEDATELLTSDEEWSEGDETEEDIPVKITKVPHADALAAIKALPAGGRIPIMRVPARVMPSTSAPEEQPSSTKGRPPALSVVPPTSKTMSSKTTPTDDDEDNLSMDDGSMMQTDRSPNTAMSNNAPSLVSDDGGDDSDASSSSDASEADAVDNVAEVDMEDPPEMRDHLPGSHKTISRGKKVDELIPPVTDRPTAPIKHKQQAEEQ